MSTIRYSHPTKKTSPAFTFNAGNRPKTKHPLAPGPGAYNSPVSKHGKQSSSKFALSDRDAFPEMNWETPGPGYYASSSRLSDAPSYSLGPRNFTKTDKHLSGLPGPANYSPRLQNANKGPAFSMGIRRAAGSDEELPGPGAYDAMMPDKLNKSYHFGTSTSRSDLDHELPGPGQYEQSHKKGGSPSYMFAGSSKLHSYIPKKTERLPGPGSYTASPKSVSSPDKGFSFVPRRAMQKPEQMPWTVGPGTYNQASPTSHSATPSFSMGKSKRFSKSKDIIPAANFYDPQESNTSKGMPVSFGTTKRPDHFRNKSTIPAPGPGYYKVKNETNQGRAAMMFNRGKSEWEQNVSNPGPGDYEMEGVDTITKRAPMASISATVRTRIINSRSLENPGPGTYHKGPQRQQAKGWSFGLSNRQRAEEARAHNDHFYNIPSTIPNVAPYQITKNMLKDKK